MTTFTVTKDQLKIDQYALDEMLIQQAMLYFTAAQQATFKSQDADVAKDALNTAKADAYQRIRDGCITGNVKFTETLLANDVALDSEVLKAHAAFTKAKFEADEASALRDAFSQRSFMLRDLVQLQITGYFMKNSGGEAEHTVRRERIRRARVSADVGK